MDDRDRPATPEVDEALRASRKSLADRERAKLAIAFGGAFVLFAIITVITQPSSAKSYVDDSPGYWIALATVFALIGTGLIVGGVRALRTPPHD